MKNTSASGKIKIRLDPNGLGCLVSEDNTEGQTIIWEDVKASSSGTSIPATQRIISIKAAANGNSPMITVLGSSRHVEPYTKEPKIYNTFTDDDCPKAELDSVDEELKKGIIGREFAEKRKQSVKDRANAEWLNKALQRGDTIWLITDPVAHQKIMEQRELQSAYLDLELPMLGEYATVPAVLKFEFQLD
jgi:hypothetical protein